MGNLTRLPPWALAVAVSLWGLAVGCGLLGLERYNRRPGETGDPARRWPTATMLPRDPSRPNLVLALHPRCPCSQASLTEFSRILARTGGRAAAHVIFVKPEGTADGWERTGLWRAASALPGVRVACDVAGREAERLGAVTSGQVVLYDVAGELRFSGGITSTRGHEGDNPGVRAVLSLLLDGDHTRGQHPVFGCPLFDPGRRGGGSR